jgi:hypothetical protein
MTTEFVYLGGPFALETALHGLMNASTHTLAEAKSEN